MKQSINSSRYQGNYSLKKIINVLVFRKIHNRSTKLFPDENFFKISNAFLFLYFIAFKDFDLEISTHFLRPSISSNPKNPPKYISTFNSRPFRSCIPPRSNAGKGTFHLLNLQSSMCGLLSYFTPSFFYFLSFSYKMAKMCANALKKRNPRPFTTLIQFHVCLFSCFIKESETIG